MNTEELHHALHQLPIMAYMLGGVLASDQLPVEVADKPKFYVVNTDPSHLPGEHWTAFYFPKDKPAEYFDSLGKKPSHGFQAFLERNSDIGYLYGKKRLQGYKSNTCGHFCLFYATYRCELELDINTVMEKFSDNLQENDGMVRQFVHGNFHLDAPQRKCMPSQVCSNI